MSREEGSGRGLLSGSGSAISVSPPFPSAPHILTRLPSALCFVLASLLLSLFPPLSMPPSLSRAPLPLSDLPLQADLRQAQRRLPQGLPWAARGGLRGRGRGQ